MPHIFTLSPFQKVWRYSVFTSNLDLLQTFTKMGFGNYPIFNDFFEAKLANFWRCSSTHQKIDHLQTKWKSAFLAHFRKNWPKYQHFLPLLAKSKKFEDTHIQFSKEQKLFTTMSKECQINIGPKMVYIFVCLQGVSLGFWPAG